MLNGSAVAPAKVTRELPEPYWVDRDDEEAILFYEFPSHEIQIEQTLDGISQNIIVTNRPLMARDEQRIAYGVDKPWPPN